MELYLMWGLAFEHLRPNPGMWWVPWSVTALLLGSSAFMIRLAFPLTACSLGWRPGTTGSRSFLAE